MRMEWMSGLGFEAARRLSHHVPHHGHSFLVTARGMCTGVMDLHHALSDICAPWQYQDLSAFFNVPSDVSMVENIAHQLQQHLGVAHTVSLRSAPHCGVERSVDGTMMHWLTDEFSAAHFLPHVPAGHQCGRLHGHGFKVRVWADASECTLDDIQQAWQVWHHVLDHAYLNELEGLSNPTSETLCDWLWQRLLNDLPAVRAVDIFETHTAGSRRDETGWTIWKEQYFEAACPLIENGRYTGHSYLVRLFLHDTPDPQTAWVRDFADVKAVFKPFYQQLDHFALDTITDLKHYDCAHIAQWLAQKLLPALPELSKIEVFENTHDGARWSAV